MIESKNRLAKLLVDLSYIEGEVVLTSGKKSSYYFDCKQTALHPEGSYLIGRIFLDMLSDKDVAGVGGMTLGADPLVGAVTVLSHIQDRPLPGFIIRKKPKGHGTNQYLEGLANLPEGTRVAVLEDVVTTGGTLVTACERVKGAGLEVACVCAVLDRNEGGRQRLAEAGFDLQAMFTVETLLDHAGQA